MLDGVVPRALVDKEVGHRGLTQLHIVGDMHERKALMAQLSDGFIALPGGIGTLEELFEVMTWAQLGLHQKPIGLLNVEGFYDDLLKFMGHLVDQRFLKADSDLWMDERQPELPIQRFKQFVPTRQYKWMDEQINKQNTGES